jgi:hypothetical protein
MGEGKTCTEFWWESPKKKSVRKQSRRSEDETKMDLKEIDCRGVWSGFTWLRIGIVGGLL